MARHGRTKAFRWFSWVILAVFTGLLLSLVFAVRAQAAAPLAPDLPGVEICPKEAPFAQTPESGLAGLLGERPLKITKDDSPEHIWSTGGFSGMRSYTYDLGCAMDPTSWVRITNANTDSGLVNAITSISDSLTSLTDSVDRRAWEPGWVTSFLNDFASKAVGVANTEILLPFFGVGILCAVVLGAWRASKGETYASAATNAGWVFVVLLITSILLISPMFSSKLAQTGGGLAVTALNQGANASDSTTNQIVERVQYQGWLRRTFGNEQTEVGRKYGPALLASTRVSWAELDAVNASSDQGAARTALTEKKQKQFSALAEKIKNEDATAYRYLTGVESSSVETIVEFLFVLVACISRLMVSILMIACAVVLVLLAVLWVITSPIIVLPKVGNFVGMDFGMSLINASLKGLRYVLEAALGSWLFGVYLQMCLAPGNSLWFSLLLLAVGSAIFWAAIGPIAKLKSIITLGRSDDSSVLARLFKTYVQARLVAYLTADEIADRAEEDRQEQRLSEAQPTSPATKTVHATIFTPAPVFTPERATTVDGEPLVGKVIPVLPSGVPVYERSGPTPPPDNFSTSTQTIYERTDDNEGADR